MAGYGVSPVAAPSGDCPHCEPTTDAQPCGREPLFMHPKKRPCQRDLRTARLGGGRSDPLILDHEFKPNMKLGNDRRKLPSRLSRNRAVAGQEGGWHGADGRDRRSTVVPLAQPRAVESPYRLEPRLAVRRLRDLRPVLDCRLRLEAAA